MSKRRYPELFQSGETAYGLAIVDAQHPHDLFMEIAGRYEFRFNESTHLFVYGGPLGEPALGPTAYPHRASASENPVAVLGHHQEDSTHVSNSVITLGLVEGRMQLEVSTFHGGEPNENRWNIDGGKPDSFASRLTAGIAKTLTAQFSMGRINNREALHPTEDTFRITASVAHLVKFSSCHIATSLIEEDPIGRVQAYTFGYERDLPFGPSFLNAGLGIQATAYGLPAQLKSVYGNHPSTVTVFFHLRPKGKIAQHMRMMHQH